MPERRSWQWSGGLAETTTVVKDLAKGELEVSPDQVHEGKVAVEKLSAGFGPKKALEDVSLGFKENAVTAIIGPSGCGKSTLLRCLNRMHEVSLGGWVNGRVLLDGEDIYSASADPVNIRRRVGMLFQKPNPFPTMSIIDNVSAGLRFSGLMVRKKLDLKVEECLRKVFLWDEVKDRLRESGASLSGGQQQRLCLARALAVEPEVVLMDEPCSALDPIATQKIEELIVQLKQNYTIVIVTHNMQQAARVSDFTGLFWLGELIEFASTSEMFTRPKEGLTEAYITGRMG